MTISLLRLCYLFSLRDGHHVDETWSYGFANSYYDPYIYGGLAEGEYKNVGEWLPGEIFKDYVAVKSDERFRFDSVLFNKRLDLSPPLYALILHFVCSLFPESFSWNYAFVINVLFYIPTLLLVFMISYDFTGSRFCSFACLIYYVFSGCGTASFLYLRIYHMFTFFTLVLFWLIRQIINGKKKHKLIYYSFLPVVTFLGAFNHYYFLVVAFLFTFFSAILLLIKKCFVESFRLCYIMLFSVMGFFSVYPLAMGMILPFTGAGVVAGGYAFPYHWNLRVANKYFFIGTIGFYIDFTVARILMFCGIICFASIVIFLLYFLFRNENWMKGIKTRVKSCMRSTRGVLYDFYKSVDSTMIIALITTVLTIIIIPYSSSLYKMGFIERYFFPVMSLFVIVYVSSFAFLIKKIINNGKMTFAMRVIVCTFFALIMIIQCRYSNTYTDRFKFSMREHDMVDMIKDKDCYIYTCQLRDLIWLSAVIGDSDSVFIDYKGLYTTQSDIDLSEHRESILLIVDNGFMTDEQKTENDTENKITLEDLVRPQVYMTLDDYIRSIENASGNKYIYIDEYPTFIGNIKVYKPVY
jgi:hypothetical protein